MMLLGVRGSLDSPEQPCDKGEGRMSCRLIRSSAESSEPFRTVERPEVRFAETGLSLWKQLYFLFLIHHQL
jgi:hypothetical protein